jgi:glycosyltransferase involved in cell wall biosynthesis
MVALPRHEVPLKLVAVGRVTPNKNAENLIRALHCYRGRFGGAPSVDWVGRIGECAADQQYFQSVTRLIGALDLERNWRWLGERCDIPEILSQHDALIHPAFSEGLPNAVCEGLAAGLPVLASSVSDLEVLVENGVRGYTFDPRDPLDIARSIRDLSMLPWEGRATMGQVARRYAEKELSIEGAAGKLEQLLLNRR